MPKFVDFTGLRFNNLTVIEQADRTACGRVRWLCRCDCGALSKVQANNLRKGVIGCRSCSAKRCSIALTTHGHSVGRHITPTYHTWAGMKARCENPKHASYSGYGGAGITVCDRWASFDNFLADMGEKPSGASLDRINNDMGYSPENCRWATLREQAINKRSVPRVTHNGLTLSCTEWAERTGIKSATIRARLRLGWSAGQALGFEYRAPVVHAADPSTGRFIKASR